MNAMESALITLASVAVFFGTVHAIYAIHDSLLWIARATLRAMERAAIFAIVRMARIARRIPVSFESRKSRFGTNRVIVHNAIVFRFTDGSVSRIVFQNIRAATPHEMFKYGMRVARVARKARQNELDAIARVNAQELRARIKRVQDRIAA